MNCERGWSRDLGEKIITYQYPIFYYKLFSGFTILTLRYVRLKIQHLSELNK